MKKFLKYIIVIAVLAVLTVCGIGYWNDSKIKAKEEIVKQKMSGEVAQILKTGEVKEINIDAMRNFFTRLKETYGSCTGKQAPVCVSSERYPTVVDNRATKHGSSITCTYAVSCDKAQTKIQTVFKQTGEEEFRLEKFNIE